MAIEAVGAATGGLARTTGTDGANAAFEGAMRQAGAALPAALPPPVLVQPAQPGPATLGTQVLDTLERFGRSVNSLQRIGQDAHKSLPPGPASLSPQPAPATGPVDQLNDVFRTTMADQARLYGLVTEVSLGRAVAGSVNTTMKTLLTQSG